MQFYENTFSIYLSFEKESPVIFIGSGSRRNFLILPARKPLSETANLKLLITVKTLCS